MTEIEDLLAEPVPDEFLVKQPVTLGLITFPTLYARARTGATLIWWMEQEGDKYRSCSGQEDGAVTKTEWTVALPKNPGKANATTGETQATAEVEATYKKKKKEKYKDSKEDIDIQTFVKPMLAEPFLKATKAKDVNLLDGTWIAQTKYNGVRCLSQRTGLFSRKGESYVSTPHIIADLVEFFDLYPDAVLDGELYNYNLRQQLNRLVSLCRKSKSVTADELAESEEKVRNYVYDGYGFEGVTEETPYEERKAVIDEIVPKYSKHYRHVPSYTFSNQEELDAIYNREIDDFQEGLILRKRNSPYVHARTRNLVKMKPTDDAEFIITDITEGLGDWSGKAKRIHLRDLAGKEFNASFKGNMAQAEEVLRFRDNYIGKTVTIYYNGLTGLGTPNYAQFDYNNWNKGEVKQSEED